jgi:hypothetical protein
MLPGETIATGAPTVCPDCEVWVLPLVVLHSGGGYYIGTRCGCTASYSRESEYYPTRPLAEAALADRSFGRDGIVARNVAAYWPDQPANPSAASERSFAKFMRQMRERKIRFAQLVAAPAGDVVEQASAVVEHIDTALAYAEINIVSTRRFTATVLHNTGPWRFHRYLPGDLLERVFDLTVQAASVEAATELVFAIANSYPDELLCDPRYGGDVAAYRAAGLRSLSVGDVLLIRDQANTQTAWACGWTGFARLSCIPAYQANS